MNVSMRFIINEEQFRKIGVKIMGGLWGNYAITYNEILFYASNMLPNTSITMIYIMLLNYIIMLL